MSIQSEINRINNNVQSTLNTIADTGVDVGTNSDALPAAAAALANEKQNKILKVSVTILASAWAEGEEGFTQTVDVSGGTANSKVDLQPTLAQLAALQGAGVAAMVIKNDGGVFSAECLGAAPTEDMTIQGTITELAAEQLAAPQITLEEVSE